jgi:hypothetical protein
MAIDHGAILYDLTTAAGKNAKVNKRDRSNENFMKRWCTFKKNGFEVHQAYDAEVYICIRRKGEKYEFKSTDKALPLSEEEKVSNLLKLHKAVANGVRQDESFPLPVLVTAIDVARSRSQDSVGRKAQQRRNGQDKVRSAELRDNATTGSANERATR